MTAPLQPVVFEPLIKPKPWGGQRLASLFGKTLPPDEPIGESWELVSLPGNESRVRGGPLAGTTLSELVRTWERDLLGAAALVDGRFPLLIKFLDARENLSVQVHPRPPVGAAHGAGVKHEAWYVVHAEPGARLYAGLNPGVTAQAVAAAANTPGVVGLLHAWNAKVGDCFYLPSGTPHALGAGLVVAEIQTPSDVTYRFYDWGRVDAAGRPRALHIANALRNIRYDVTEAMIRPVATPAEAGPDHARRLMACHAFSIDACDCAAATAWALPSTGTLRIWMALRGRIELRSAASTLVAGPGDVVLIPAAMPPLEVLAADALTWLEVKP